MYDLREFIESIEKILMSHALGAPGAYRRWKGQNAAGDRDLGINEYGCADAANILYTIGSFPAQASLRDAWINTLQNLQHSDTGYFVEVTHHEIHTTAHCIAALELFDAQPQYPLTDLKPLKDLNAMHGFLDELEWDNNPWRASHKGAGLYAAMVMAGEVDHTWEEHYFKWLYEHADPETGFWRKGHIAPVSGGGTTSLFPHLASSFHYLFNHEYSRKPLRYPDRMVDSCLKIREFNTFPLGSRIGFAEIDWVFCLSRSLAQSGHRYGECMDALGAFAADYIDYLIGLDPEEHEGLNDLHSLFGMTCCLAELQRVLPGTITTVRPLKLVLDRRPFI